MYCKILNKVIEEANRQHCIRLTKKSDKIKRRWNNKKWDRKNAFT
jgi:hypothetical protein